MSGRRFGGAHSPGGGSRPEGPRLTPAADRAPVRAGFWARAMWVAPAPLFFALFGSIGRSAVAEMTAELAALALFYAAAWLLGEGVKAEAEYAARRTARRPAIPRKMMASAATGLGVAVLAVTSVRIGLIPGVAYGVVAALVHGFAFGIDPLRDKGMDGIDGEEARRAGEALEKAEATVRETLDAAARLGDRELSRRVETLCASARAVFRKIEDDPADHRRARRFLTVHLAGARDATVKYARLGVSDPEMRGAFDRLLGDLEKSFEAQRHRLDEDDRTDLEVEIEVLQDRLKQEGLG